MYSKDKFSLSIGCKSTRFASVNVDIDPQSMPDLVCDATNLPFKECSFEEILFSDVLEHLDRNAESLALREIRRVIAPSGNLILTTPNDYWIFTHMDPAFYFGHRHYTSTEVENLLNSSGFEVKSIFTMGGIWECLGVIRHFSIEYPLNRILKRTGSSLPEWISNRVDSEYRTVSKNGYTIICLASPCSR